MVSEEDLVYLRRCVELAKEALDAGDQPFGSVLVSRNGEVLAEDRNRTAGGDQTRHPEFELARWAAAHLDVDERAAATVFTSGEHCPMCAAAHAWVGLDRIVYASSSAQLVAWRAELGAPTAPVQALAINVVAPQVTVEGPAPALADEIRNLHARYYAEVERPAS